MMNQRDACAQTTRADLSDHEKDSAIRKHYIDLFFGLSFS
jgi:hypothetical protein